MQFISLFRLCWSCILILSITVNVRMTNKDYYYYFTIILKSVEKRVDSCWLNTCLLLAGRRHLSPRGSARRPTDLSTEPLSPWMWDRLAQQTRSLPPPPRRQIRSFWYRQVCDDSFGCHLSYNVRLIKY